MASDIAKKMKQQLEKEKERLEKELSSFAHRKTDSSEVEFETKFPNLGDKEDEKGLHGGNSSVGVCVSDEQPGDEDDQ